MTEGKSFIRLIELAPVVLDAHRFCISPDAFSMYQFARFELFSRKGRDGRSTDFIFDEVSRAPSACMHVRNPGRPEVLFGLTVDALRSLHDERTAVARTLTSSGKARAIRKDQNTLVGIVLSHPATVEAFKSSRAVQGDVKDWERRSVDWLRSQYGDQLITVVRHVDESHPHLHAYLLPADPEMKAAGLHPGFVEKNAVRSAGPRPGEGEDGLNKRSNRAYVAGMRSWLDDYHDKVCMLSGLTRFGPGRRRLTRAAWHQEQHQAKVLRVALDRARAIEVKGREIVIKARAAEKTARVEQDRAEKAVSKAARERQAVEAALRTSDRLRGLGGLLRAFCDGFRVSQIREVVSAEFSFRLDQVQRLLDVAKSEARYEREKRSEADRQVAVARSTIREAALQRNLARAEADRLRSALENKTPSNERGYRP